MDVKWLLSSVSLYFPVFQKRELLQDARKPPKRTWNSSVPKTGGIWKTRNDVCPLIFSLSLTRLFALVTISFAVPSTGRRFLIRLHGPRLHLYPIFF